MKYITLPVYTGPTYNQTDIMSSMEHQALQWQQQGITNNSVEALTENIKESVAHSLPLPEKATFPLAEGYIPVLFNAETGEAIPPGDNSLAVAYQEYLDLPKATLAGPDRNAEIYSKWVILLGRAFVHPHPHRHFTAHEFYTRLGLDESLAQRFLK